MLINLICNLLTYLDAITCPGIMYGKGRSIKHPRTEGYRLYWIFDHSSCHAAYPQDALNASHMNVKPGGAQPIMHDNDYNGKLQQMVLPGGTPKGLWLVLEERGVNVTGMKLEDMQVK